MQAIPPARPSVFRTTGITVTVFPARPGLVVPRHGHDLLHAALVVDGRMAERDRDRDRVVGTGGLRISPPGDEHRIRFGNDGGLCAILGIEPHAFDGAVPRVTARRFLEAPHLLASVRSVIPHNAVAATAGPSATTAPSAVALEALALEILAAATGRGDRPAGSPPAWLVRVRDRLRDEPHRVDRIAELARDADVTPGHLVRAFRLHFGCAPGHYLRLARVDRARRMVLDGRRPLASVAHACGFADQAHMTRHFRRWLGQTPGRLRRGAG